MTPQVGWSELLVIGLIALIVIGPKDLPLIMRQIGRFMTKARNMAAEFQAGMDELGRQAELTALKEEALKAQRALTEFQAGANRTLYEAAGGLSAQTMLEKWAEEPDKPGSQGEMPASDKTTAPEAVEGQDAQVERSIAHAQEPPASSPDLAPDSAPMQAADTPPALAGSPKAARASKA